MSVPKNEIDLGQQGQDYSDNYLVKIQHGLLEIRRIFCLWPLIFPIRIPVPANFHRFLKIWGFGAQGSYLGWVFALSNTLTSNRDIAAI